MKKVLLILGGAILLWQPQLLAQRKCGIEQLKAAMIAKDPTWAAKLEAQRTSLQGIADNYIVQKNTGVLDKTTAVSAIPIIFHICVDSAQYLALGGEAGIATRCASQMAVLNADYNRQNSDSNLIPTAWKDSLYGNVGIHFGLARIDPSGACTPGYEIKIVDVDGYSGIDEAIPGIKTASTGLAAWDITKYYNVWCGNFNGDASGLLGITRPLSFGDGPQTGVVILYTTLGVTPSSSTAYPYNLGRTLTHETGHFFEIWHTWGDDGGACEGDPGGSDDGLSDTPPESDATYGNPVYILAPYGTDTDVCRKHAGVNVQPIGIASLSYMDYTNDNAMHLFTPMQAAVMASMALVPPGSAGTTTGFGGSIGENYSLTQHPGLLVCGAAAVNNVENNNNVNIYPNPTTGMVNISLDANAEKLDKIIVVNLLGQQVKTIQVSGNQHNFSIDLSGMGKGIYFVKCNFASGSVTNKISLQ